MLFSSLWSFIVDILESQGNVPITFILVNSIHVQKETCNDSKYTSGNVWFLLKGFADVLVLLSQLILKIKLCRCCFQHDLESLVIPHKVTAGKIQIVGVILQVKKFRKKKFMRLWYREWFSPNCFKFYSRIHNDLNVGRR